MGIFSGIRKSFSKGAEEKDFMALAEDFEQKCMYAEAIANYNEVINSVYEGKDPLKYVHLTKKIIGCAIKMNDYERVMELWKTQYHPLDYGAKEMYELIKILEAGQRIDLVMKVYDMAGKKLLANKVEFLIRMKKIPEANAAVNELLVNSTETTPGIERIWLAKAKLAMSLTKFEEANRYLTKIVDKDPKNLEARKLKDFCVKQARY